MSRSSGRCAKGLVPPIRAQSPLLWIPPDEELLIEGFAREIVNKINTMRREAGFAVTDRIRVSIDSTDRIRKCFDTFGDFINNEVLAVNVTFGPCQGTVWDLNGEPATIALAKA